MNQNQFELVSDSQFNVRLESKTVDSWFTVTICTIIYCERYWLKFLNISTWEAIQCILQLCKRIFIGIFKKKNQKNHIIKIYDRKSWLHKWEQEVLHTFFLKLPEAHPCHVPDHVLFPIIIRFNFYLSGKTLNLYNQKFFKHPPPSNCV